MFYLSGRAALSVVDRKNRFQVAKFLKKENAGTVWQAILQCWVLIFVGPPDSIRHDAGSTSCPGSSKRQQAKAE